MQKIKAPANKLVLELLEVKEKTSSGFYMPTITNNYNDVVVGKVVAGTLPIDVPTDSKWDVYFKKSHATEIKVDEKVLYVIDVEKVLLYKEN